MKFKIPYANNFDTHESQRWIFFSIQFPTAKRAAVPGNYFPILDLIYLFILIYTTTRSNLHHI